MSNIIQEPYFYLFKYIILGGYLSEFNIWMLPVRSLPELRQRLWIYKKITSLPKGALEHERRLWSEVLCLQYHSSIWRWLQDLDILLDPRPRHKPFGIALQQWAVCPTDS